MTAAVGFLRSFGSVLRNSVRIEANHLRSELARAELLSLFKSHVELIEVETTSYCNRVCSFCPNSFLDRRSEKHSMPEAAWDAILSGLRELDYSGGFVWSRYSEPLSERRIVERIHEVRSASPRCRICINSNGDYLDSSYLEELEAAGLNRLWIDLYSPEDEQYDQELARRLVRKFLERIGREGRVIATTPELALRIESSQADIECQVRNRFSLDVQGMSNRAGLIQVGRSKRRLSPCYTPFKHLVIDWDGSVVACCQLRSDVGDQRAVVAGRIGQDGVDLLNAYLLFSKWRESLRYYGEKRGPCAECNVFVYHDNPVNRAITRHLGSPEDAMAAPFRAALRPLF